MPLVTVALNLSPGSRFAVHTLPFVAMPTREPEPITPAAAAGVGVGAGLSSTLVGCGGVGRGVRATGACWAFRCAVARGDVVRARGGSGRGVGAAGARAAGALPPMGASLNTVGAGPGRCAMARSCDNDESGAGARSRHPERAASASSAAAE